MYIRVFRWNILICISYQMLTDYFDTDHASVGHTTVNRQATNEEDTGNMNDAGMLVKM